MEKQFLDLLTRPEGDTLDFKSTGYDITDEGSRTAFVKDVICLANTPRDCDSFLVLGVKKYPSGKFDLIGLNDHPDDADLQGLFVDRIYPSPTFSYSPLQHAGKQFGLVRVPPVRNGPCVATKDIGTSIRQWQVYFRRQSRNTLASPQDMIRILSWFGTQVVPRKAYEDAVPAWQRLVEAVRDFDPCYQYVLVTSPGISVDPARLAIIGAIPWAAVFDFDVDSDRTGLLTACRALLEKRRSLHINTLRDSPPFNLTTGTYWYFARGLRGRSDTIHEGRWVDWNKADGAALNGQLRRLSAACSPTPVVFVVFWPDVTLTRHLQSTLDGILAGFGNTAAVVFISTSVTELQPLATETGATLIDMPADHFCWGLSSVFETSSTGGSSTGLPSSSGTPIHLPPEDVRWIEEELQLVDLDEGLAPPVDREIGRDFLKGGEISWYDLGLHYDIDRDISERLAKQLDAEIEIRRASRVSLYHAPGAGGTTVGRRMIWSFHRRVPCAILRKTKPRQTVERLVKLTSVSGMPALVLVDGAEVSSREMDELYDLLRSQQAPVIVLQVLRRFMPQSEGQRTFYLKSELSNAEATRFAHVFARENPARQVAIQRLVQSSDNRLRSAFYFGLYTFLEDFRGLEPFVAQHLRELTAVQKKLMGFIALSHHYAQKPFPAQAFASELGLPENRRLDLAAILKNAAALLVRTEDGLWRTAHELVATEILEQLLWPTSSDRRLWKQNLSGWAREFAQLCRGNSAVVADDMVEIVRRTFFFRDNTELLGTERSGGYQFAQLIEDIPSREGKLEILKFVTDVFPSEPHFWAHLGRFLALQMKDYVEAGKCIDRAMQLDPSDSVLHHMRGMTYRYELYQAIEGAKPLSETISVAKSASESFARARALNPDDDHGYISEVQMLARLVMYAGQGQPDGPIGYLGSTGADPFLRESLQRAEELLEGVRRHREGEGASTYEVDCRAKLDLIYGRHDKALQVWDSLLTRSDVYAPPVRRQIIWTYLARRKRNWDDLPPKEVDRIVRLLEDNLVQEPESEVNLRLWVQAVRRSTITPPINSIIEKVSNWRARSTSLDASYYLYVLYSLQALDGVPLAYDAAIRFLEECRSMARFRRDRTKSYEWLGKGAGARRLVHHSQLGDWDTGTEFWQRTAPLARVEGRIVKVEGLQAGEVELPSGLRAFFVPAKGGFTSKNLNHQVSFYLGFSFDGPRAWDAKPSRTASSA